MRLKQELATTTEHVSAVLKREQLKRETAQHAKAVREMRKDFASLKREFPSLLNAKEDEELFYDKERVIKKVKQTEQPYVLSLTSRVWNSRAFQSHRGSQAQAAQPGRSYVFGTAPRYCCTAKGARCGNPGAGRSGDGPDQRARSSLGRRNRGEPFTH
jgi:hypothetical protein